MNIQGQLKTAFLAFSLISSGAVFNASAQTVTNVAVDVSLGKNGKPIDVVVFGDTKSEKAHKFSDFNSQTIKGALGEPARQMLPKEQRDVDGGNLTFTMKIDPVKRNYVSVKFWGDDETTVNNGRIYVYVVQDGKEYQLGYRHEGDYMPVSVTSSHSPTPGRFNYSTTILPLSMTKGKKSIQLRLQSTGRYYAFGKGDENNGGNMQFNMKDPSRGVYRAYTHTDAMLDVSGEVQGKAPEAKPRATVNPDDYFGPDGMLTKALNRILGNTLQRNPESLKDNDIHCLAMAYNVKEVTVAYQRPEVITQVIVGVDAFAKRHHERIANNKPMETGWGGPYGYLGMGAAMIIPEAGSRLDEKIELSDGKTLTRRELWGNMFIASRDQGRFNRRGLGNQSIYNDICLYGANMAALALGDPRAFTNEVAQRYLRESSGIDPFRGSDLPDGGYQMPYGASWHQTTLKGQSREWGSLGNSYGEMQHYFARYYRMTGNPIFREQAIKFARSRTPFRRPTQELGSDGQYHPAMEIVSYLAWRGASESDGNVAGGIGYASRAETSHGLYTAAATMDPTLIAYAKQLLIDDNQFFNVQFGSGEPKMASIELLAMFEDYRTIMNAPDTGERLPMSVGQPDYAWADEQNSVLALKQGENRLWISAYWQAKRGTGVNRVGRFHYSCPDYDQYGTIETDVEFTPSGETYTRPSKNMDYPEGIKYLPPNAPLNAYGGEVLPLAKWPADASNRDPYIGRVDLSTLRFGNWLIAFNSSETRTFNLSSKGLKSAKDLISGETKSGIMQMTPLTTIVLDLRK